MKKMMYDYYGTRQQDKQKAEWHKPSRFLFDVMSCYGRHYYRESYIIEIAVGVTCSALIFFP